MNVLRGQIRYGDVRGYLGHYAHADRRAIREQVAKHLKFPNSLRSIQSDSVWGIAMVRDEADIIEKVIRHQIAQGISPLLVADNNSVDDTPRILERLAKELPLFVVHDSLSAYQQAEKMTALSRVAFGRGAKWVVPFDADEMWFAHETTVGDFLSHTDLSIVRAPLHNVYPGGAAGPARLDLSPQSLGKVAFRASHFVLVGMGNHTVVRSGRTGTGLYVAHFPWRTRDQLRRKVRQGRQALEAAAQPLNVGSHWRALANLAEENLSDIWTAIENQRPHPALGDPFNGPFQTADPQSWTSWHGPTFQTSESR